MGSSVAYNPSDPTQQAFLAALSRGEGHDTYQGTGGYDLHGAPTDQYGFPLWNGFGNSHAAGWFQFQPATWDAYAATYNLNFGNTEDQKAAAWYLAQDTYSQATGRSLSDALAAKDYSSIQTALAPVWPSVTGNGASPEGLSGSLASGKGSDLPSGSTPISSDTSTINPFLHPVQYLQDQFQRWGLLLVGGILMLIALWWLLADQGVVPSPKDVVKTAGKVAALA